MQTIPRILLYSPSETAELVDQSILLDTGYEIATVTHPQAIETWLNTFLEDVLLIVAHPSARDGLKYSSEILNVHPSLPVILVARKCSQASLKRALEIGLIDFLTAPVNPDKLLGAIERGLSQQKRWQEWKRGVQTLANIKEGVIVADLDGQLLVVNQSACNLFQFDETELVGRQVSEVFQHPDLLDLFTSQSPFPRHGEISLEDGRVFGIQASLITGIGIAVIFHEITHLKELDQIKTDFVNTVSHDLRSPLTAIYGFVGLIDRVGSINEQQAEFIRHIQNSVQHITSLINDLLELGHMEALHDLQMEDVSLKEIVVRSIENLDYQMNEKMQELLLSLPEELPLVLGNPIHLQRMVINLIENAVKFTPPLGKISVCSRAEGAQVILEISDTGPGIPLADQPYIFEKFYRGGNLANSIPGTGLGLSIVKSIIDKHHGRIWLESSANGTTFTVILPVR
jgi:two-component system NtrC family sensor kinase